MLDSLNPYPAYKDSELEWLKSLPTGWRILRGKNVFHSIDIRSEKGEEDLLTVSSNYGVIPRSQTTVTMFKAESYVGHKLCWPGDLVINSLWAWMQGLGFARQHGLISSAYGVYRPRREFRGYADYFHYTLRSAAYKWELMTRSKGVWLSRLQLSDWAFLDMPIIVPPPEEQAAIVRFLDHADRRIRRYSRAKQRLIALLNEQKQAIIQRAVTRGLDPNVRLKRSGVEWLGDVPENWSILRTKNLFRLRTQKSGCNHGLELLSVYAYVGVRPRKELEERGNKASTTDDYWMVQKGDIVINKILAWMGSLGVSHYEGVTSPAYDILMPTRELEPDFYHYLFRTKLYLQQFKMRSRGIMDMRLRLYFDQLGQILVPVPPLEEQRSTVDFIVDATADLDRTIQTAQNEIALLREYRTRLIADVVTGKMDVRAVAAALPDHVDEPELFEDAEALIAEADDADLTDPEASPEEEG